MSLPIRQLMLGALAAFIVATAPHSDAYAYTHDETVLKTIEEQCTAGTGNTRFCACMLDAVKELLPPEYAVLDTVSVGSEQHQFFTTSNDLPEAVKDRLSDRTTFCRQRYAPDRHSNPHFNN